MLSVRTAVALASALPFALARAQETAPAPERSLGTVTISSGQPTSLPTQIPATIEGLTREQIENAINASDSEDALKYLPSLLVRKRYIGDYNHAVLSTRASGTGNSARSMVFADGMLLSNYLGNGATFAPRWMLVMPEEIERVDVLYGPFSAAYPGNSAGAVVDFVTRMPSRFEAHARIGLTHQPFELYRSDGSFAGRQASVSLGNRSGSWAWFVHANQGESQGQPLTFATRLLSQGQSTNGTEAAVSGAVVGSNRSGQPWWLLGAATQYRSVQDHLKARLAYELSPTVRATYTLGLWQNRSTSRPQSYLRNASGDAVYAGRVSIDGRAFTLAPGDFGASNEEQAHQVHGLSVKSHTQGRWDWEVAASRYRYARDILRTSGTAPPGALSGGAGRIVDGAGTGWTTLALKGIWRPHGREGPHIVDVGLQRDTYRLRSTESASTDWLAGGSTGAVQASSGDARLMSLYAQDTWKFAPAWKAVMGLRAETWTAGAPAALAVSRREHHLSPKLALAVQASERWVLKASAGRAVRMPTVSELFQRGTSSSGAVLTNDPTLKPERSWTGELTAERDLGSGLLRLTAFGERSRDALYSQTNVTVSPNVVSIQNVDEIRTHGIEISHQDADVFLKGLELATSLTWTRSLITRNDKFPASVGQWQPRVPRWRASAVATWRPDARWSWTLGARYGGRQYSTLDNSDPNGFAYQGASRYFTVDARVRWQLDDRWSAAFGIDNLNNDKYWNFHPYPQRTYSAELKFDL